MVIKDFILNKVLLLAPYFRNLCISKYKIDE
jgi:hypothetical protein